MASRKLLKLKRLSGDLLRAVKHDAERQVVGKVMPLKPHVVNFLVNDICNSRCKMCMIWKMKKDKEVTPGEIRHIFQDELFSEVKYVGVSGGEPTLRQDLPQIYEMICTSLPHLMGTGIITNAIQERQVITRVEASAEVCRSHGKPFNLMVSLDGVGDVHDLNRGRSGNFTTAMNVVRYFRDNTDIPVSVGCTITKHNVWHVDELLEFCQHENVYARFRVAEFINRLYNEDELNVIRNFSDEERYQLSLFFFRLENDYEENSTIKRTYQSIRHMLSGESGRLIGCPYQSRGVVVDCRGQLLYCAPKSRILGSALENSAWRIFSQNLGERRRIMREDCHDCIHDYHAGITLPEFGRIYKDMAARYALNLPNGLKFTRSS